MSDFLRAAETGDLPTVQRLLAEGRARITEFDSLGWSALLYAACGGHLPIVQWLLTVGGASITERDRWGQSALMIAAVHDRLRVMQWLLAEGGADIDEQTNDGATVWSLLSHRIDRGDIHESSPDLIPLLRVMLVKGAPPPDFVAVLRVPATLEVVRQGELLRARLPGYLAQRQTLIRTHVALPPMVLVEMVAAYAEPSLDDLWGSEELVRDATTTGTKRKRGDEAE